MKKLKFKWIRERKELLLFVLSMGIFGIIVRILFTVEAEGFLYPNNLENFGEYSRIAQVLIDRIVDFFAYPPLAMLNAFLFNKGLNWSYSIPFYFVYYSGLGIIDYFIAGKLMRTIKMNRVWLAIILLLLELLILEVLL